MIHQTQDTSGSNAGKWELIQVESYNSGTGAFTFRSLLDNTYTTGAQIIKVTQYTSLNLSGTFTIEAWDGSTGGLFPAMGTGKAMLEQLFVASGKALEKELAYQHREELAVKA